MTKQAPFIYAIRDGEGYWFQGFVDGEVFFVSPQAEAKPYDNAAKALTERDALAQMCGDDSLTVRQIGPTTAELFLAVSDQRASEAADPPPFL
jgi:hypothetical protein